MRLLYCITIFIFSSVAFATESAIKNNWLSLLEAPKSYVFEKSLTLLKRYEFKTLDIEVYRQANGIGTFQTLYIAFPKNLKKRAPAVVPQASRFPKYRNYATSRRTWIYCRNRRNLSPNLHKIKQASQRFLEME